MSYFIFWGTLKHTLTQQAAILLHGVNFVCVVNNYQILVGQEVDFFPLELAHILSQRLILLLLVVLDLVAHYLVGLPVAQPEVKLIWLIPEEEVCAGHGFLATQLSLVPLVLIVLSP